MIRSSLGLLLGLLLALFLIQALSRADWVRVRISGSARNWLRARAARQWGEGRCPQRVQRTYWTAREYLDDCSRLTPLGYREEDHSDFTEERERMGRLAETLPGSFRPGLALTARPLPYCVVTWELAAPVV